MRRFRPKPKDHIVVEGVGNLMTHIARCCQPIPGDAIQGFITMGRGVSIHREDCEQLKELSRRNPERLIDAVWGRTTPAVTVSPSAFSPTTDPACCATSPPCSPTRRST